MVQEEKTATPTNEPVSDQAASPADQRRSPATAAAAPALQAAEAVPGHPQAAANAMQLDELVQNRPQQGFVCQEDEPAIVQCPDPKQSPVATTAAVRLQESDNWLIRYWVVVSTQFARAWRWYLAVVVLDVVCYVMWTLVDPDNKDVYKGVAVVSACNSLFSLLVKRSCLFHVTSSPWWPDYGFAEPTPRATQSQYNRQNEDVNFEHQVVDPENIPLSKQPLMFQRRMESLESQSTTDYSPESPMDVDVDVHRQQKTPTDSSEGATGYSPGATGYSPGASGYTPDATGYSPGVSGTDM